MLKKSKRYYFKKGNVYYGVIQFMGAPLILSTEDEEQAIFHFEHEVEYVTEVLLAKKVFADPVKFTFYGNFKPTRDKIV